MSGGTTMDGGGWQFWIDRGGTFTDVVARRPDGGLETHKLLSDNPEHYRDAAIQGIREVLGIARGEPVRGVEAVKMGTTVATNALLERKGDRTLLVVNRGFRDALRIGYQTRPRLFDLRIVLPEMLYERVVEVDGRVGADGELIAPLDAARAEAELRSAFADGIPLGRDRAHARLPLPGARARPRAHRARDRIHPGLDELRDEPAHEARRPR